MSQGGGARPAKSDPALRDAFRALVPDDEHISVKPMFGSLAAFAEGQMFMGLYANDVFVRLGEAEREQALAGGGAPLEPMPGRPMREYVVLPGWQDDPDAVRRWAARALDYALSLPPKKR